MTLLHNMSSAPRSTIIHETNARLALTAGALVQFPQGAGSRSAEILLQLGLTALSQRDSDACLRELINKKAREIPYPPAALVSNRVTGNERAETDLLTICTLLAKSSDRIYLADKEPNLGAILPSRRIVVHLPKEWRRV